MKHLLIILISILLLSSPVIGDNHKGETLYQWGEYPEIVWKGFGEKETHFVYKGEVEKGVQNGLGILISPMGGKVCWRMEKWGEKWSRNENLPCRMGGWRIQGWGIMERNILRRKRKHLL